MRWRRLALDSNVLALLVFGEHWPDKISASRRLSAYKRSDYEKVRGLVGVQTLVLAPNVLTEVSNLFDPARDWRGLVVHETLRLLVEAHGEIYIDTSKAAGHSQYRRLGLTDAVLLLVTDDTTLLVTADEDLYLAARAEGKNCLHLTRDWLDAA